MHAHELVKSKASKPPKPSNQLQDFVGYIAGLMIVDELDIDEKANPKMISVVKTNDICRELFLYYTLCTLRKQHMNHFDLLWSVVSELSLQDISKHLEFLHTLPALLRQAAQTMVCLSKTKFSQPEYTWRRVLLAMRLWAVLNLMLIAFWGLLLLILFAVSLL